MVIATWEMSKMGGYQQVGEWLVYQSRLSHPISTAKRHGVPGAFGGIWNMFHILLVAPGTPAWTTCEEDHRERCPPVTTSASPVGYTFAGLIFSTARGFDGITGEPLA